jgi:hypothetical protein
MVGAILAKDRQESDASVTSYAECQPGNHDIEDCAIDIEQEHRKAGKEEEKGSMDKYGHSSGYPVEVQLLEPFCVESTNASSVARIMSSLSHMKVRLSPLLYKYCYKSPSKTHKQAQEPK